MIYKEYSFHSHTCYEYKIVQWYDTTYIPDPVGLSNSYNSITDLTPNIGSYSLATTNSVGIPNYLYDLSNNQIQLGYGPCGFSFAPDDGLWEVERIMFRSAFITNDLNSNISFLGIFLTDLVNSTPLKQLTISQAVARMKFYKKVVYPTQGSTKFGFDSLLGTYYEFHNDTTCSNIYGHLDGGKDLILMPNGGTIVLVIP